MMSGHSVFHPCWDDASPNFSVRAADRGAERGHWEELTVRDARRIIKAHATTDMLLVEWYDPNCEQWVGLPDEYGHRYIEQAH